MTKATTKTTDPQEITERIAYWEANNTGVTLEAFLGWTINDYMKYVNEGIIPNPNLNQIND